MAKLIRNKALILLFILVIASFLRLRNIDKVPVSLFGDELDAGYQAYSILKTGRDYYGNFLPIHFHSLAEWRTPLYLYSIVPTVALFGISPLGVRLPASIFGILSVLVIYLLINEIFKKKYLALLSALVLTFSPWHIQYSRAGFEVTLLILLLLLGLYFFYKSIKNGKWLWVAAAFFMITPWVYSTAKLFVPILLTFLILLYKNEILKLSKKHLLMAALSLLIVGGPIAYGTVFGGGAQRFAYISVFTDPTTEPEIGFSRLRDARVRGELGEGLKPTLFDRVFHNKFVFWAGAIMHNYFQSFSTEFLFIKGDLNLRHSIGIGELYKIEVIPLLLGFVLFITSSESRKSKLFILFWLLSAPIPSIITRDGGNHATRLILVLPPLVFLIAYGLYRTLEYLKGNYRYLFGGSYLTLFIISFLFYQHQYWGHYPWDSERWWHAGFEETIQSVKEADSNYDKVVISTANEPPWIFFAGFYQYDPKEWQKNFPIGNDVDLPGFGKVSHIDKFYFGSPGSGGVYDWGKVIDKKTLYLASAKEVNVNLIMEPERTPKDLNLMKAIAYPSGEPAFYLFTGK